MVFIVTLTHIGIKQFAPLQDTIDFNEEPAIRQAPRTKAHGSPGADSLLSKQLLMENTRICFPESKDSLSFTLCMNPILDR